MKIRIELSAQPHEFRRVLKLLGMIEADAYHEADPDHMGHTLCGIPLDGVWGAGGDNVTCKDCLKERERRAMAAVADAANTGRVDPQSWPHPASDTKLMHAHQVSSMTTMCGLPIADPNTLVASKVTELTCPRCKASWDNLYPR